MARFKNWGVDGHHARLCSGLIPGSALKDHSCGIWRTENLQGSVCALLNSVFGARLGGWALERVGPHLVVLRDLLMALPLSLLKGPEDGGDGIQVDCMLGRHPVIPTLLAPASGELNLKSCPFFPLSAGNSVQPQV